MYRADWFRETLRYTLQGVGLLPVFVTAMRFPDWGPFHFLNRKRVAFFGGLTYSLYLVHHVVLFTVRDHLPGLHPVLQGVLGLLISVAIARAIYASWSVRSRGCASASDRLSPRHGPSSAKPKPWPDCRAPPGRRAGVAAPRLRVLPRSEVGRPRRF